MNTFLSWLSTEPIIQQVLSDESKEKVCIITDINKLIKMVTGKNIEPVEFDYMYDMPLPKLQEYQAQTFLNVEAEQRWRAYRESMRPTGDGDAD